MTDRITTASNRYAIGNERPLVVAVMIGVFAAMITIGIGVLHSFTPVEQETLPTVYTTDVSLAGLPR